MLSFSCSISVTVSNPIVWIVILHSQSPPLFKPRINTTESRYPYLQGFSNPMLLLLWLTGLSHRLSTAVPPFLGARSALLTTAGVKAQPHLPSQRAVLFMAACPFCRWIALPPPEIERRCRFAVVWATRLPCSCPRASRRRSKRGELPAAKTTCLGCHLLCTHLRALRGSNEHRSGPICSAQHRLAAPDLSVLHWLRHKPPPPPPDKWQSLITCWLHFALQFLPCF